MTAIIHSDRLNLISFTPAFLRASFDGDLAQAEELIGLSLPPDWPIAGEGDFRSLLAMRLEQIDADPTVQPWLLRAIVPRGSHVMAGHIGFHTAPGEEYLEPYSPGAVEFGYTVYPPHRRLGYAREAARAMMHWAEEHHGVTRFVLTISPDNTPSQNLAAELGFVRIGEHIDDIDGLEDILERKVVDHDSG